MLRLGRFLCLLLFPALLIYEWSRADGDALGAMLDPSPTSALPALAWMAVAALLFVLPGSKRDGSDQAATTHGSASWATTGELRDLLRPPRAPLLPGALSLAPYGRRQLVLPPALATRHMLVIGPSGAGKTRGLFMPNTAVAAGSFVATDPKGELWQHTSGYHERAWRFAPREPEASRGCNWIPLCADVRLAELLASAVMQVETEQRSDTFWTRAEQQLCTALFVHAAHQPVPTPATAYALLQDGLAPLLAALAASPAPAARSCAAMLDDLKAETTAAIVVGVANKLAFLREPAVARFTSAEPAAPDFAYLTREPVAVYWLLHEQDVALLQGLSSLFFTLLLDQLARASGGAVPVTLFLDEFAHLGRLPHFPTTISVARGRGFGLVLGVQSLAQLEEVYGRQGADTIRTNCTTRVILHGLEYPSAEQVSRSLGEATLHHESRTRRPAGLLRATASYSEQQTGRRLLTADEVRRVGRDELLIITENRRPIRAGKWRWDQPPNPAAATALGDAQSAATPLSSAAPPSRRHPVRPRRPARDVGRRDGR